MVEKVLWVRICRIIRYRCNWLNGREIDGATLVCALRLLISTTNKIFLLRFWGGKFQSFCYPTNWKRAIQYILHIVSVHLKIGHSACTSELYGCNIICLSCFLFSRCNNATTKTIQLPAQQKQTLHNT